MRNSAIDIWNDLRAKRLWPVALLLLAAIVAVSVLVMKDGKEPPPAPVADSSPKAPGPAQFEGLASVELEENLPSEGSSLDTFDPSDPFRPPEKVLQRAEQPASSATANGPTADTITTTAGGSSGSGSSSSPGGGDTGSSGDTGSTGGPGDGKPNRGGATTEYTWVLDVTFTNNGRTRKLKGLERLCVLPGRASALFLFLGVSSNGGNAVFLVDSTLDRAGEEGKCRPGKDKCAFLYMGAGSAQVFTSQAGDAYGLKIDRIRKVKVTKGSPGPSGANTQATRAPKITGVAAMRSRVGGTLTISGRNFENKRLDNTVMFRAPDGRSTLVKPRRASRTRLVVTVPAVVGRLLSGDDGTPEATRFKMRVLTGRLGRYTPRRLSPVITG